MPETTPQTALPAAKPFQRSMPLILQLSYFKAKMTVEGRGFFRSQSAFGKPYKTTPR